MLNSLMNLRYFQKYKYLLPYIMVIIISMLVTGLVIAPAISDTLRWDAEYYAYLSNRFFADEGYNGFFYDPLRTYGYPLFLLIIRVLTPNIIDWLTVTKLVQFGFHTATACISVNLLGRIAAVGNIKLPYIAKIICFTLVQLNLWLLALSQEILTDSLSVFILTLFFYYIVGKNLSDFFRAGLCLGTAVLIRPFYLNYSIALFTFLLVWYSLANLQRLNKKSILLALIMKGLYFGIPFILLVASQVATVYGAEKRIAVAGGIADWWSKVQLERGFYYYKFESYVGDDHTPEVTYYSERRRAYLDRHRSDKSVIEMSIADIRGTFYMVTVKIIGMFQTYEWSGNRQTLQNSTLHPLFLFGFLMLLAFVYSVQEFFIDLPQNLLRGLSKDKILFVGILLHVGIYSMFMSENRFVAPIFPILIVYSCYIFLTSTHKHTLLLAYILSMIFCLITFEIIRNSELPFIPYVYS